MINSNGMLVSLNNDLVSNRAFLYGDAVFETLKIIDNKIIFFEDHYFRLMASMRIVRMKIPKNFTMEFLEEQILSTVKSNGFSESARVRITVYRNDGGFYLPKDNSVSYLISCSSLLNKLYEIQDLPYEVELFKDFYVTKQLLSTIKSTNKLINTVASIFASENAYQNCFLMNDDKNIIEVLNGNIFMLTGNNLITPPISEGCLNGIMRKQLIKVLKGFENIVFEEAIISPFDLQKADEIFITNIITGIQPITKYRKKAFQTRFSKELLDKVNQLLN